MIDKCIQRFLLCVSFAFENFNYAEENTSKCYQHPETHENDIKNKRQKNTNVMTNETKLAALLSIFNTNEHIQRSFVFTNGIN